MLCCVPFASAVLQQFNTDYCKPPHMSSCVSDVGLGHMRMRLRTRVGHYYKYNPVVNYLHFNFRANLIRAEDGEMHKPPTEVWKIGGGFQFHIIHEILFLTLWEMKGIIGLETIIPHQFYY